MYIMTQNNELNLTVKCFHLFIYFCYAKRWASGLAVVCALVQEWQENKIFYNFHTLKSSFRTREKYAKCMQC